MFGLSKPELKVERSFSSGQKHLSRAFPFVIFALVILLIASITVLTSCRDKKNNVTPSQLSGSDYTSPTALAFSSDGKSLYVADATGWSVFKVRLSDNTVESVYNADGPVNDVETYENSVLIAVGELGGRVVRLDSSLKEQNSVVTGHTPSDLCVAGGKVYVANRFSNTVSCIDLSSFSVISEIPVGREPISLALSGSDLYVACHLPDEPADADMISADVCIIDTDKNVLDKKLDICNGAGSVLGICADSDGANVYLTHIISRYQLPTTQLDGGWVNTNAVTLIDSIKQEISYTFLLDNVDLGAANPWGITLSDNGKCLYVALSGTNQIARVDLVMLKNLFNKAKKEIDPASIADMIDFATTAKKRLTLDAVGIRSIAVNNGIIYAGAYFSGEVVTVDEEDFVQSGKISLKEQPEMNDVRRGELLFYDATTCYQMWQSCNSCHPDVRADGFNWDNLNDGVGTSKQAKSLLFAHRTPPVMVTGIRKNAEVANEAGYKYIEYNADYAQYVPYINAFLKSLLPVQSPYLNNDGTLTKAAEHGKELFVEYGCVKCHPAPLYTDLLLHESEDLKLGNDWEYRPLDTPTLIETWRTAPWTYIGHYNTMADYIKFLVQESGSTISDSDASDLAEFVLSIGIEGENYGVVQLINEDSGYNNFDDKATIVKISIIKQIVSAPDGKVRITVYGTEGNEISSQELELKDLKYGVLYEYTFDKPIVTEGGSYVVISFTDAEGNPMASNQRFN
ncbi:MAG: hypothetical protein J5850_04675 [Clostridia bacterium]|nr:hypothetical protein [Clostridia bacterium]